MSLTAFFLWLNNSEYVEFTFVYIILIIICVHSVQYRSSDQFNNNILILFSIVVQVGAFAKHYQRTLYPRELYTKFN